MKKTNRIVSRFAGIFIFALSLTPGALAQEQDAAPAVAAADGLMNVAVYDAFKSAGVDEAKARAAAQSVAIPERDELATKSDLADLRAEIKAELAEMQFRLIMAGGSVAALLLLCIIGVWRKIAELAEKMPTPTATR